MAAATIANRREVVYGSHRIVMADVTIANNGDTWVTGLKKVLAMSIDPTTNASAGGTKSGGTITFATGGALVMSVIAFGY
jgi:hypothetical protein